MLVQILNSYSLGLKTVNKSVTEMEIAFTIKFHAFKDCQDYIVIHKIYA